MAPWLVSTCGLASLTMARNKKQKHTPGGWLPLLALLVMTCACANPHAILNFTGPSTATVGAPFTVTVTATIQGERDTLINSPIHFTSSDPNAVLPPDYTFTAADAGSHTWTNGFVLNSSGRQTISATTFDAAGINGTVTVTVQP